MASKKIGSVCQTIPMIESQELAFFIASKKQILLIDGRSLMEFNNQSILNAINISSSKLLKRRLQQDKMAITEVLQGTNSRQPVSLDPKTMVIVYDHCTESVRLLSNDHFVYILLRKLSSHYEQVFMLKGGIVDFQTHYPNMCERRTILPLDLAPKIPMSPAPSTSGPGIDTVDGSCSSARSPPFLTALSVPVSNIGPTRILDHLYLGSQADAMDADVLRANGVTHVLNVSSNPKTPHVLDTYFFRIEVNDGYVDNFLPHFQKGFLFLEKVREAGGRALVHCLAGISRSPTLAIAYLMQYMHMSSDDAYRYVKERRANIAPNFNFLGQLLEFERQLREKRREEALKSSPSSTSTPALAAASSSTQPRPMSPSSTSTASTPTSSTPTPSPCPSSTNTSHPLSTVPCSTASEGQQKKKRPCLNRPSFFPAEKKSAKSSIAPTTSSPPAAKKPPIMSSFYEPHLSMNTDGGPVCKGSIPPMRPRTVLPPSSLSFPVPRPQPWAPSRQSRLELPRSATAGQISSPTTAFARLTFDSAGQFSRFPTTSLDKLSFMPCHSAVDRPRQAVASAKTTAASATPMQTEHMGQMQMPRSRSAVENLGAPANRPPWLNIRPSHVPYETAHSSSSSSSSSSRMRSPLTPRKQLTTLTSPLPSSGNVLIPLSGPLAGECPGSSNVAVPPASRESGSAAGDDSGATGSRKSRSLEDMLEGLVPTGGSVCFAPEGASGRRSSSGRNGSSNNDSSNSCRLTDHTLHHSSSSLSSSAASGSQHSSMHSSMEILQVS